MPARESASRWDVLVPEGWVRLRTDDAGAVAAVIDRAVAEADVRRRDLVRVTLRRRLDAAVHEARERGVWELWIPVGPTGGIQMPASVAVAPLPAQPDAARTVPDVLLGYTAAAPGAVAVEIGGALGVRLVTDRPERRDAAGALEAPPVRLVSYIVSPPYPGSPWTVFTASVMIPDGDEHAEVLGALVSVVDSVMATVAFEEPA